MQPLALPLVAVLAVFGAVYAQPSATTWSAPALASIVAGGKYVCSATIIDDFFAITAGSCIENLDIKKTDVYVRVGNSQSKSYAQSIKVIETYIDNSSSPSPGPGPNGWSAVTTSTTNLGMVKVESRFQYGANVKWASPTNQAVSTNTGGYVAIWAGTKLTSNTKTAPVEAISSTSCATFLSSVTLNSTQTCLSPTISSSRPCKADLGAPFYHNGLLYGVVSYSLGCKSTKYPTVVTSISNANNFIIQCITGQSSWM